MNNVFLLFIFEERKIVCVCFLLQNKQLNLKNRKYLCPSLHAPICLDYYYLFFFLYVCFSIFGAT